MAAPPRPWPKGVEPISVEDFDKLGINAKNELFWEGERLVTRIVLTWPQKMLALLATIASLATIAGGINNTALFLCARNVDWLGCPAPASPPPITVVMQPALAPPQSRVPAGSPPVLRPPP